MEKVIADLKKARFAVAPQPSPSQTTARACTRPGLMREIDKLLRVEWTGEEWTASEIANELRKRGLKAKVTSVGQALMRGSKNGLFFKVHFGVYRARMPEDSACDPDAPPEPTYVSIIATLMSDGQIWTPDRVINALREGYENVNAMSVRTALARNRDDGEAFVRVKYGHYRLRGFGLDTDASLHQDSFNGGDSSNANPTTTQNSDSSKRGDQTAAQVRRISA